MLLDPELRAYRAFGFERGHPLRVWADPRAWWRYARIGRLERPEGDTLQLGGDVLADAEGRIIWVRAQRGPDDRPARAEIAARAG